MYIYGYINITNRFICTTRFICTSEGNEYQKTLMFYVPKLLYVYNILIFYECYRSLQEK